MTIYLPWNCLVSLSYIPWTSDPWFLIYQFATMHIGSILIGHGCLSHLYIYSPLSSGRPRLRLILHLHVKAMAVMQHLRVHLLQHLPKLPNPKQHPKPRQRPKKPRQCFGWIKQLIAGFEYVLIIISKFYIVYVVPKHVSIQLRQCLQQVPWSWSAKVRNDLFTGSFHPNKQLKV